jgi:hypothetical protein
MQHDVKLDCSDKPIRRAIVLEADRPWFFGAHAAVDLEGLEGNGKHNAAPFIGHVSRNVVAFVPNVS